VWHLDSGAARNNGMRSVPVQNAVTNNDVRIKVASGDMLAAPMEGELYIHTPMADRPLHLKSVLVHARMGANLLSVSQTCASPDVAGVWFDEHGGQVITPQGEVLIHAIAQDGVYIIDGCKYTDTDGVETAQTPIRPCFVAQAIAAYAASGKNVELWHCKLGHMGHSGMRDLQSAKAVADLDPLPIDPSKTPVCAGCAKGKSHRAALGKGQPPKWVKAKQPMDRWHADVVGPLPLTLGGKRFLYLITDEASD